MDVLLFIFLLLSFRLSFAAVPTASTDSLLARNDTCVSIVLHDFYKDTSRQSQMSNSPCNSKNKSAGVFWLGVSMNVSKEQFITHHLRIGVPIKYGFFEFMKVDKKTNASSGFPVDVFQGVIMTLPYKVTCEFVAFEGNDSLNYYDHLISKVHEKEFDAIVGDTTINANRSNIVDFTYPYMDAGVRLIVPVKSDDAVSAWWFLKPLSPALWLTTLALAVFKGILVWFFEREINPEFQGPPSKLIGNILSFSFSTFVFAHHEKIESNYSRFIVNLWVFNVFVLVTAYAANLTSMLTVDKFQPTITDLETLRVNGDSVGYQSGSFVFNLLQNERFQPTKLKPYSTVEQYVDALESGSSKGGVSAIMDEIPYIRVFLKHHCRKYTMAGRTYRTGGFGFVFPRGSAMVPDISRAVMNFTEGDYMYELEKKWFGEETTCPDAGSPITNQSLPLYSLRSIYIMTGVASTIALFVYFFRRFHKPRTVHNASSISSVTVNPEGVELMNNEGAPTNECSIQNNENQLKNGEHDPTEERGNHNDVYVDALPYPIKK